MACVSSLSNKLQMPRQHKELWAVCEERARKRVRIYICWCVLRMRAHTHTHTYSLSLIFLFSCRSCCRRWTVEIHNNAHAQKQPPLCTFPSWYSIAKGGVVVVVVGQQQQLPIIIVGITQCAVHTMPTTDANTTCPTQNNPLSQNRGGIWFERDEGGQLCAMLLYIHTCTHTHTHTYMCVCVCMCIYMRMRVSPPPPPLREG
jgi:hypothetical protein